MSGVQPREPGAQQEEPEGRDGERRRPGRRRTSRRRGSARNRSRRDWAAAGRPTRPIRGPAGGPRRCGSAGLEGSPTYGDKIVSFGRCCLPQPIRGVFRTDSAPAPRTPREPGIYRILPAAVCLPADREDVASLARWASAHRVPLVPRGRGQRHGRRQRGRRRGRGPHRPAARASKFDAAERAGPSPAPTSPSPSSTRAAASPGSGCHPIPRAAAGRRSAAWSPPTPPAPGRSATAACGAG